MDTTLIQSCLIEAKAAHSNLPHDARPSIDALFLAAYLPRVGIRKAIKIDRQAPTWFTEKLRDFEPQHATAASILGQMGRQNPSVPECKQCGIWLTSLGVRKRKTNGKTLFIIGA